VDGLGTVVVARNVLYARAYGISATEALNARTSEKLWRLPEAAQVLVAGAGLVVVQCDEAMIAYGAP
jgi:hypothetical protein